MAQNRGGTLVELADRRAAEKGGAGLMNLFPKPPEGRVGIQGGSGKFGMHVGYSLGRPLLTKGAFVNLATSIRSGLPV